MMKVSVLYPNTPGTHFDMNYYLAHHMPLAVRSKYTDVAPLIQFNDVKLPV
jgi:hypothetical protein